MEGVRSSSALREFLRRSAKLSWVRWNPKTDFADPPYTAKTRDP